MSEKRVVRKAVKHPSASILKEQLEGFKQFILSQGLIGMAIGLILGTTSVALVKSLIDNVIMPPIGLILGSAEGLKGLRLAIGRTVNGELTFINYGIFLNDLINFAVIAVVVYFIIVFLTKFFGEEITAKK